MANPAAVPTTERRVSGVMSGSPGRARPDQSGFIPASLITPAPLSIRGQRQIVPHDPPAYHHEPHPLQLADVRGLPETAMMSAYLPRSIDPIRSCQPITVALTIVPDWIACSGDMPARLTKASNSIACTPCG